LHAKTLAWMQRFGDRGIAFEQLCQRVLIDGREPGKVSASTSPTAGCLKGAPIDFQ
jgi:hypothetical protein